MRRLLVALVLVGLSVLGGDALAHGDLESADPKPNRHLRNPPDVIALRFVEPPTDDSDFEVRDGCREEVLAQVAREGPDARLEIDGGAPGRWKVTYRVVSSVDGHLVQGSYAFHVGNKKPCEPQPEESDEIGEAAPPIANDDGDEGGGFPVVPALIGAGVVGAAVVVRLVMGR